jgi:hypothetical protein
VGIVAEAGVVESQAVAAAALGPPRGGGAVAALVATGRLAAERGGGSARDPKGRLHVRDSRGCSGSSGLLRGLRHPEQFAEEKGGLCILYRLRLQGGEVVLQDGGPCVVAHGIIQPLVGHLLGAEAVGAQEELLQLLVRFTDGGGIPRKREDGGDQRER